LTGIPRDQLATRIKPNGAEPGDMMSPKEMGNALYTLRLIDRLPSEVILKGDRNQVINQMMQQAVGKYFSVSFSDGDGTTGHNVVARRTSNGIEVLDGQVNTTYDINRYPAKVLDVYPLDRTYNPALH
jgi:hypothetical protein